jgi:hypothetical protein
MSYLHKVPFAEFGCLTTTEISRKMGDEDPTSHPVGANTFIHIFPTGRGAELHRHQPGTDSMGSRSSRWSIACSTSWRSCRRPVARGEDGGAQGHRGFLRDSDRESVAAAPPSAARARIKLPSGRGGGGGGKPASGV